MITATIIGNQRLVERIQSIPSATRQRLEQTVKRLTLQLEHRVKTSKLQGDPLHQRSGRLSRSVNSKFDIAADHVLGTVGAYAPYASVHEFGWDGTVPAHTRTSKLGKSFTVRAHHAHYPERSFLRSSLAEMAALIRTEIKRSADAAMAEALKK